MRQPETPADERVEILLLGEDSPLNQRVKKVLVQAGFSISTGDAVQVQPRLVFIQFPVNERTTPWLEAEVGRVAICKPGTPHPMSDKRFEAFIEADMSAEEIVRQANEAFYRSQHSDRPPRYAVSLEVVVRGGTRIIRSTTVDISRGGLFVRSLNPPEPGSRVRLTLVVDVEAGELTGSVVYTIGPDGDIIIHHGETARPVAAHPGMAIRFDDDQAKTIERWLEVARRF